MYLVERTPGDGFLYQFLVVNLSDLSVGDRKRMGAGEADPLFQVTLVNWAGRPSLILSGYVAPHYAAEKLPSLSERAVAVFCDVVNSEVLNLE